MSFEVLEDRVLLSAGDSILHAIPLSFSTVSGVAQVAHASDQLAQPGDVRLYQINLTAGDVITASASTSYGGLDCYLRILQNLGTGGFQDVASNGNLQGLDPGLTFQAPQTGTYYVGVSSFDNTAYNPQVPDSGAGSSQGLFDLDLFKTATLAPPLTASSFQVSNVTGGVVTGPFNVALDQEFFQITLTQPGNLTAQVDAQGVPTSLTLYDAHGIIVQSNGESPSQPGPLLVHSLTGSSGGTVYYLKVADLAGGPNSYNLTTQFTPSDSILQAVPLAQLNTLGGNTNSNITVNGLASTAQLAVGMTVTGAGIPTNTTVASIVNATSITISAAATATAANVPLIFSTSGQTRAIAEGDFNGDGRLDLAVGNGANVTILLGNGDGTFQRGETINVGYAPQTLVVGDFNGDGNLDLACSSYSANDPLNPNGDVTILHGNGDGTFTSSIIAGASGNSLATADFNGDGRLDLAVVNSDLHSAFILLNDGAGGFNVTALPTVTGTALVAADFNGDGRPDLAVADRNTNQVTVLVNEPGGTFLPMAPITVGTAPVALVAGEFTGDHHEDLAVANLNSQNVTVLLGDGHAGFPISKTIAVGSAPGAIVAADFNGDGRLDLATANPLAGNLTVLVNDGAGAFHLAGTVPAGADPAALAAGDFNGDGKADLASANYYAANVTVLLGHGDGSFPETGSPNATGFQPDAIVQADFNGDGRLDLAVANLDDGTVSILLGQNDGTFQNVGTYAVGNQPDAIVAADFNRDGRIDLAIADFGSDNITVLMGQGDGTFVLGGIYAVPGQPAAMVAGDFDGTGNIDLAVALKFDAHGNQGTQVVLLGGDGRGSFGAPLAFTVGTEPVALAAGDFNGDGRLDLAVADYASQDVIILLGTGGTFADNNVTFQAEPAYTLQGNPMALVAGDFAGDHHLDFAVATLDPYLGAELTVFLNDGHGQFPNPPDPSNIYSLNASVSALVAGDFNGDGNLDIAAAETTSSYSAPNVTVLLGTGAGKFQVHGTFPVDSRPSGLVAGDFNGDGRLDLVTADYGTANVTALLGTGTGDFVSPTLAPSPVQSTPLVAPLTGAAIVTNAFVLTQTGQILFRRGLADQPGAFAPPVVLNPAPQQAARDLALVSTAGGGSLLAALDMNRFSVSLYQPFADGVFTTLPDLVLPAGFLPANIASADLMGNGLGDLVISAAGAEQIFVSLQTSPGVFGPVQAYAVGLNSSAIKLIDVNDDGHPDIVVTDRFSGEVSVLLNQGNGVFLPEQPFRAGTGPYDLTSVNGGPTVQSLEGTSGVVAGSFDTGGGLDLVALNSGDQSFSVLFGDGHGGFLNPQTAKTFFTNGTPTAIVSGDFNGDGNLDLAVLTKDTITIYLGDGAGNFTATSTIDAGNQPTGLSVADVTRPGGGGPDGIPDLLVGNAFGDLLILAGNGDGTFSEYRRAGQLVSLAVTAAKGQNGQNGFFFSDQGGDALAFQSAATGAAEVVGPQIYQDRSGGIQAPGAQTIVTVAGVQYLVVLNSGANDLLIYTLGASGLPIPASKQTFYTGTDPVGLTVTGPANDLNGDAIPDVVVANQGSNDVSVFVGAMTNHGWTLDYRPRQASGGLGPTSVAIAKLTSAPDALPALLVSNGQSNDVSVLDNRGDGYFVNDKSLVFATGINPQEVLVGDFNNNAGLDLVTINAGSNDVTLIANFRTAPVSSTISSGGTLPSAALAIDVNGATSLLVANAGNGVLEMLTGSSQGFEVAGLFSQATAPHLSDLAAVTAGSELEVYGTVAGRDVAVLLGTFGLNLAPPAPLPPSPGFPGGVEIIAVGPTFTNTTFDASALFALPFGAVPEIEAGVSVASNDTPAVRYVITGTDVVSDSPDVGVGMRLTGSSSSSSSSSPNRSRSLLLNFAEPPPVITPIDPKREEESDDVWDDCLPNGDPSRCEPISTDAADLTMPPIRLDEGPGHASCFVPIVIELQPRLTQAAPEPSLGPVSPPRPNQPILLGFCYSLPLIMAQLLDTVRPAWPKLKVMLRRIWT